MVDPETFPVPIEPCADCGGPVVPNPGGTLAYSQLHTPLCPYWVASMAINAISEGLDDPERAGRLWSREVVDVDRTGRLMTEIAEALRGPLADLRDELGEGA